MPLMTALHTSKSSNRITNLIEIFEQRDKDAQPANTLPSKVNALKNSSFPCSRGQSSAANSSPRTIGRNVHVLKPCDGDAIRRTVLSGARVADGGGARSVRSSPAPVVLQLKQVRTPQTSSSPRPERTQPQVERTGKRVAELRAVFENSRLAGDSPGTRTSSRNESAQSRPRAQTLQRVQPHPVEAKRVWSSTLPIQKAISPQVEHSAPPAPTLGERAMDWVRNMTADADPEGMADALASGGAVDPRSREVLVALDSAIAILKCELMNAFDNYVCFFGDEDRAQQRNFFDAATTRARSTLEDSLSGSHQQTGADNDLDAMKVFESARENLESMFATDNMKILDSESSIAMGVIKKLVTAYREMMVTHCAGHKEGVDLEAIHGRARRYYEGVFSRSFDLSAKTSTIHTRGEEALGVELDTEFQRLQAQRSRAG